MPEKSKFAANSKAAKFLRLARPDDEGFSRQVSVDEFVGEFAPLKFGNGGDWVRADGLLARTYNLRRVKKGNRIVGVELHGFNKNPVNKGIPARIAKVIRAQSCAVLATGGPEVDHKDGFRDDRRPPDKMRAEDFQPLSKGANNAKRQHCKECRETRLRFDAARLGYAVSQWKGNGVYRGTCTGCYWHDPKRFNHEVSKPAAAPRR